MMDIQQALKQSGKTISTLVVEKNKAYGDAAHKVTQMLDVLYSDGVPPEKMQDMLLITRVLDKLVRIACGDKKAFEENPWSDVAGYGILGMAEDLMNGEGEENE